MTNEQLVEQIAAVIDEADCCHRLELTRLVDGVSTYTVTCDGMTREFEETDDAYEWVRQVKQAAKARAILPFILAAREEGIEAAAKALEADAQLCDCHAYEEDECACGAWCEWKTVPMHRAVEIVRGLIAGGSDEL